MHIDYNRLGQFLLQHQLVRKEEYLAAIKTAKEKNEPLEEHLISRGLLSEEDMTRAVAEVTGIPFVSLVGEKIPFEVLSLIPEPIARKHSMVAYRQDGGNLEVAMLDVSNITTLDFIKRKTKLNIKSRLTNSKSIKSALVQYQKSLKAEFGDLISQDTSDLQMVADEAGSLRPQGDLKKMAEDLPVVRIVETLLKHAVLQNASDIHIEPMEDQMAVRYRIDGILHDAMMLPVRAAPAIVARVKVLANLKLDEKRMPQDGRFKIDLDHEKVALRVSTLPVYHGEKVVMRLLREDVGAYSLESLGFHGAGLERIQEALRQTTGIVLVTGPTGSGKSTTLYTMLDQLNTPEVNISTIEDPVEYQMKRVNQTQVKPEIGFSFATGLRSLMRQDPDIIMVGEIRDSETASLAINAALTGHVVLSTLHTNSAAGAVPRLVDMGAERFLLVSTLRVIVGQRLLRRLTADKTEHTLSAAELKELKRQVDMDKILVALKEEQIVKSDATWKDVPFYKPAAGKESESGYKGRVGIHEILVVSDQVKDLTIAGKPAEAIEEQAKKEGMLTMIEDGIFKAAQGLTSVEEVLRVVNE